MTDQDDVRHLRQNRPTLRPHARHVAAFCRRRSAGGVRGRGHVQTIDRHAGPGCRVRHRPAGQAHRRRRSRAGGPHAGRSLPIHARSVGGSAGPARRRLPDGAAVRGRKVRSGVRGMVHRVDAGPCSCHQRASSRLAAWRTAGVGVLQRRAYLPDFVTTSPAYGKTARNRSVSRSPDGYRNRGSSRRRSGHSAPLRWRRRGSDHP